MRINAENDRNIGMDRNATIKIEDVMSLSSTKDETHNTSRHQSDLALGQIDRRSPKGLIPGMTGRDAPWAHHWAAYDIGADQSGLADGAGHGSSAARFRQAINDFHRAGYGGPCPPRGHGRHRYHFRLPALSVDHLSLGAGPSCSEVEREARRHAIAEAILVGGYQR